MSADGDLFAEFVRQYRRRFAWNGALLTSSIFVLADLVAVMCCFGFGFFVVNTYNLDLVDFKSFVTYWPYCPAFIVVFAVLHLYPGLSLAPAEELRRYTIASLFGHAGIILSLYLQTKKLDPYSVAFGFSWLGSVVGFPVARATARSISKNASWWGLPVVVFGAGATGRLVVDRLLKKPWIGYRPAVMLDDKPELEGEYRGVPILTGCDLGPAIAERCGAATAIVAMPGVERSRLAAIVADGARCFKGYVLIPDFFGMTSSWMSVRDFDGILGLYTSQHLIVPWNRGVKRAFDIVLSIVGGIVISPFVGLIALLVKLDSPGPAFYGHHRLGKDGVSFKAWKFRSMVSNADEVLAELLGRDPAAAAEWKASYKLRDDPRVTRMGKFLRKTSLDELPQIWNVLRGEMSLIGPRPIIEDEVPKYGHNYKLFSSVKPGMSGLWQVSGRSDMDYEERVALDIYYIQSWSTWLDLYILFKTVGVVLGGDGAY
jgi:Undecaprenyl-phosphate galactose phosphotransferase WbaP